MPFFSFVIPTRNRARYLQFALQSCLEQDFDDYEVVVSDNNSLDDTKDIVKRFDNGKVRYFNTGRDVGLTDNFENGIANARGEYVLLLADDEAYKISALKILKYWIDKTNASVISFGRTPFMFPGMPRYGLTAQENASGILALRPFTRKVAWVPSSLALQYAFSLIAFEEGYYARSFPLSVKSVIRSDVIRSIKNNAGQFQLPPTPDWSSCIMILNAVEKVLMLDEHLHLAGEVPESTGPNFKRKRHLEASTAKDSAQFAHLTPLKVHTLTNLCANAILQGQATYPGKKVYELDYARYFQLIDNDLRLLQSNGVDVEKDLAELECVSKQYGIQKTLPEMQPSAGFSKRIYLRLKKVKCRLIPNVEDRRLANPWPIVIDGKAAGFNNILECARNYDRITANIQPDDHALSLFQSAYGSCEVIG
jgi:hypothetical protein